jgi:hypothetical protein
LLVSFGEVAAIDARRDGRLADPLRASGARGFGDRDDAR